ncbi:MAG: Trk system potassium transporter TrkA, partial [Planctomycetes bacterium]|nr:Trk system potassium transporter TrkA [Planctomycetota bacterium]
MNIVIAGAGELGRHTAEVLGADGHNVVVVDTSASKVRALEDRLDVRTLVGNAAHADVLREAGAGKSDLVVAATSLDEVNLLIASVAKAIGAKKSIARIHHSAYFSSKDLPYDTHLGIDELICPEYLTSLVIARTLRNPAALAVEAFAEGLIEVQELPVEDDAPAARTALLDLEFPPGVRLAQIRRDGEAEMPTATSVIQPGDVVTIVGMRATIDQGRKLFTRTSGKTKNVVIMGGSAMGVWMCRALEGGSFSVRLFEIERERAEELSGKLEHVTVVQADPTDPDVCAEERIGAADVFIAVTNDDEHNILASAQAKSLGVSTAIAVV